MLMVSDKGGLPQHELSRNFLAFPHSPFNVVVELLDFRSFGSQPCYDLAVRWRVGRGYLVASVLCKESLISFRNALSLTSSRRRVDIADLLLFPVSRLYSDCVDMSVLHSCSSAGPICNLFRPKMLPGEGPSRKNSRSTQLITW